MRRLAELWTLGMTALAFVLALVLLGSCGETTKTITVAKPPNLGPPRAEAHDSRAGATKRNYTPLHGNAEQARFYNASGCGVERWAVKTLTDPAANQVNLTPQSTWVGDLVSIAPPEGPTDRVGPTETQAFTLSGRLIFAKHESDGDDHLVIEDAQGNTMIAESTDPSCAQGSLVLKQIEAVRERVNVELPALERGETMHPTTPVTVTGIGFFDRLHGQTGVAPNGIELHPLIAIQFAASKAETVPSITLHEARGKD